MKLESPQQVVDFVNPLMAELPAPWGVAGGWALDLFLGRVTRPHADIDLAIFRQDQLTLRQHLRQWTFHKLVQGRREPWSDGEWLSLPTHELHAHQPDQPTNVIEFLLNERNENHWIFRRNPSVTLPLDRALVQAPCDGPSLRPRSSCSTRPNRRRRRTKQIFARRILRSTSRAGDGFSPRWNCAIRLTRGSTCCHRN